MIALAIIIVVIAVILLLRVGATVEFSEAGLAIDLRLGFIKIRILPSDKSQKLRKKKDKKDKKKKNKNEVKKKKGGSFGELIKLLPDAAKALGRLRRRIVINELIIHATIAGDDPAETGINYGRTYAAIGAIIPALENLFRMKKREITADVSFLDDKPSVYCKATLMIAIWAILYIAFGLLFKFIKIKLNSKQTGKADESNGKTPDSGLDGNNNAENQRDS